MSSSRLYLTILVHIIWYKKSRNNNKCLVPCWKSGWSLSPYHWPYLSFALLLPQQAARCLSQLTLLTTRAKVKARTLNALVILTAMEMDMIVIMVNANVHKEWKFVDLNALMSSKTVIIVACATWNVLVIANASMGNANLSDWNAVERLAQPTNHVARTNVSFWMKMKRIAEDVEEVALQTQCASEEVVFQRSLYVEMKDVKERKLAVMMNASNSNLMRQTVEHVALSAPAIQNVARVFANPLTMPVMVWHAYSQILAAVEIVSIWETIWLIAAHVEQLARWTMFVIMEIVPLYSTAVQKTAWLAKHAAIMNASTWKLI